MNDAFADATVITLTDGVYTSSPVDSAAYTLEAGEPGSGWRSAWWSFTPDADVLVSIDTAGSSGGASADTLLYVYTGSSLGALTLVAFNDDDPAATLSTSRVDLTLTAGVTYSIRVSTYSSGDLLTYVLAVTASGIYPHLVVVVVDALPPNVSGIPIDVSAPCAIAVAQAFPPGLILAAPCAIAVAQALAPELVSAALTLVSPDDGALIPSLRPSLMATITTLEANVQAQFQYDTSNLFTAPTSLYATAPLGQQVIPVSVRVAVALTADTQYFWRVRFTNGFADGPWTASRSFTTSAADGVAVAPGGWAVVTPAETTPAPHLWFATPNFGHVGDEITAIGTGFGTDTTPTATIGGVTATVVSWYYSIAETADAFTADRVIDYDTGRVDPAHQQVVITIPAVPPPGGALHVNGS